MVLWQPSPCPPFPPFPRGALTVLAPVRIQFQSGPASSRRWALSPITTKTAVRCSSGTSAFGALACANLRARHAGFRASLQSNATVTAPTPDTQALPTAGRRISAATHRLCPRRRAWRRRRRSPGAGLRVYGPGGRRTGGCACRGWRGFSRRRQLLSTAPSLGFSFRTGWAAAKLGQRHADAQRCRPGCGQWEQKGGQHFLLFHHRHL